MIVGPSFGHEVTKANFSHRVSGKAGNGVFITVNGESLCLQSIFALLCDTNWGC